jgi:PHD-zinc-finger like domain
VCVKIAHKKHGAKIQCTRGKCSKAFHVSCAIEQEEVDYKVVEETESEVVVIGSTQDLPLSNGSSSGDLSVINSSGHVPSMQESSTRMVKIVRKYLVSVLCSQHNPVSQTNLFLSNEAQGPSVGYSGATEIAKTGESEE